MTNTIGAITQSIWGRLVGRYRRGAARWMARRVAVIDSGPPVISFTFDDFPQSALLTAGSILEGQGLAGTYYASLGLMGQITPTGKMFHRDDLEKLRSGGHELGCHTFAHCHAWETRPRIFEASILQNREELRRLLPGVAFATHSYPISCPRPGTKQRAARYFACCRGGGQTFNVGLVDLNHLAAYFLEQSRDKPEKIREMIDRNCDAGAWLILATHDVCEKPGRFGCTVKLFDEIVHYAVRSGATVLPVFSALQVVGKRCAAANVAKL